MIPEDSAEKTSEETPEKAPEKISEIKELSSVKVELKVTVPLEEVDEAREKALATIGKKARIKGFRKGKVPREALLKNFGKQIEDEALSALVPGAYERAVKEQELRVIPGSEKIDPMELKQGEPLVFGITVEVKPEIELKQYKGYKLKGEKVETKPADVDKELESLRQRQARFEPAGDDYVIADGDYVLVDFKGTVDGKTFKGGHGRNYALVVGQERSLPGFEKELVGLKKSGSRDFELKLPDGLPEKDLEGKKASFHVDVKEVRKKELPELNDEFAKKLGNYKDLAALKQDIGKGMRRQQERERRRKLADQLFDQLIEKHKVAAPESMVKREEERLFQMNARQFQMAGGKLAAGSPQEKSLREECRRGAEKMMKSSLVLEKIAELEKVTASEEEVEKHIDELAAAQGLKPVELRHYLDEGSRREGLRAQMIEEKTIDLLIEAANIKE